MQIAVFAFANPVKTSDKHFFSEDFSAETLGCSDANAPFLHQLLILKKPFDKIYM